jgi:RimJ/RimL family protein N-acetyltransferase
VDNLAEVDGDPEVMCFTTGGKTNSREDIETDFLPAFLAYYHKYEGYGFWAAIEKSSGDFIGWVHFRPAKKDGHPDEPELGYRLRKAAWGQGLCHRGGTRAGREGLP